MSVGFRRSLFGFNSDDVMKYIEKTHKDFVEKETLANEKIDDLTSELENAKKEIEEILVQKDIVEKELKEYTDKYDEIERLSQNIGRLYLVAETNAASVIESAKQNKELADIEVAKNIECADKTFDSLSSLKEEIDKTSIEFSNRINNLLVSLKNAKNEIYSNNSLADEKIEEYKELADSIKV